MINVSDTAGCRGMKRFDRREETVLRSWRLRCVSIPGPWCNHCDRPMSLSTVQFQLSHPNYNKLTSGLCLPRVYTCSSGATRELHQFESPAAIDSLHVLHAGQIFIQAAVTSGYCYTFISSITQHYNSNKKFLYKCPIWSADIFIELNYA